MGVQSLKTFINNRQDVLEKIRFSNEKLVIDGPSLYYSLYYGSELDQSHGGDYVGFRDLIQQFFQNLSDCGITPYVLLDGGSDGSNIKLDNLFQRAKDKISKADKISKGVKTYYGEILPPLVKDVFKQVLFNLDVPFAQCFGEADLEVFFLANQWGCAVLSNDSDFYIYDIPAGFLNLSEFKWKETTEQQIPATKYTVQRLSTFYDIDPSLLPVFGSIAGNDYVRLEDHGIFVTMNGGPPVSKDRKIRRLDAILKWLVRLQYVGEAKQERAVEEALKVTGNDHNTTLRQRLLQSIRTYTQPCDSSLAEFFNTDIPPVKPASLHVLPDWTIGPLIKGKLTSFITDVLLLKRMILSPQVEDSTKPSGHVTARPIRQYLYGLLLNGQGSVREYDREGKEFTETDVESQRVQLKLEELDQAAEENRLQVLMEALGVLWPSSASILDPLPDHLKLPVCVLHFWRNHSDLKPSDLHLTSLLLGVVYGELCKQMREGDVMERMRDIKLRGEMTPLDQEVAHLFSQWQSCLKESLHLNQLLCFPLKEPDCTWLYCGPLVHQLVADLRSATCTSTTLLTGDSGSDELFKLLLQAAENLQHETNTRRKEEVRSDEEEERRKKEEERRKKEMQREVEDARMKEEDARRKKEEERRKLELKTNRGVKKRQVYISPEWPFPKIQRRMEWIPFHADYLDYNFESWG